MSVGDTIAGFLERSGISHRRIGDDSFAVALAGEHRLQIGVTLAVSGDDVVLESFFMRAPQENVAAFYEMCLKRNQRARHIAFALDGEGDVFLVGRAPSSVIDEGFLDGWLGAVLIESDGMFKAAIEVGFASYLAADMAWRATQSSQSS